MTRYIQSAASMSAHTLLGSILGTRTKDRMDYMLEPFQAMTQICCLSFLPIGTKLSIHENILYTNQPSITQGIVRYIAGDGKDDLYYLCHVFVQFVNWYGRPGDTNEAARSCQDIGLFDLMMVLAKNGLDRLIQTYRNGDRPTVLHTLGIYRMILANPNMFMTNTSIVNGGASSGGSTATTGNEIAYRQVLATLPQGFEGAGIDRRPRENIYSKCDMQVVQGLFQLMTQQSDNQMAVSSYMMSIDHALKPRHDNIRHWIMDTVGL